MPTSFGLVFLTIALTASATTYEVGPGKKLSAIGEVPWESLLPGDTVLIHARPEPYKEKFVLCRAGTADATITVRGVPDADGKLPVIDGNGATTRSNLNYWGDTRSVVKIGGARKPADTMPRYLVIENLDISGALRSATFTAANGEKLTYKRNAAAIYVEKCEHLVIRNCILHDSGNGLFVSSNDERASRDILIESNYIFDNGNPGSGQEHNIYTAAIGIIFQHNRLGPLRSGCVGNNLKDRSAGLVVRYNWIEGGNKELDLVDAQDSRLIRNDPHYHEAFVYGNVFLKLPRDVHPFLVHYGGDGDKPSIYRKGTLFFFNNTVIYYRGSSILFRLSSNGERCDFRNNLVYFTTPKSKPLVLERSGTVDLSHNWFPAGWARIAAKTEGGNVHDDGTSVSGPTPGFVDLKSRDFRLAAASPCRDAGGASPLPVEREYVPHQSAKPRPNDGKPDIGAFEFSERE